jgi:hypothetical protein
MSGIRAEAIILRGRGGPYRIETSRHPQFLVNRLADGSEVVSPMRRPLYIPRKIPVTKFCLKLNLFYGHSVAGRTDAYASSRGPTIMCDASNRLVTGW